MSAFTLPEFINFLNQFSLAIAGAAALWGWVFMYKAKKSHQSDHKDSECYCYKQLAGRLMTPLVIGFLLFVASWALFTFTQVPETVAHEGIVIVPTDAHVEDGYDLRGPFALIFALVTTYGYFSFKRRPKKFGARLGKFYALELLLATVLISFSNWTGFWDGLQAFFIGHSWHSILTAGTVIIVDYLFHHSYKHESMRKVLYPNFDLMSKMIWLGLGIEFISVAFVFQDAIALTPKFFFMQSVVGILIVNGAILSGPITRRLVSLVGVSMERKKGRRITVAGRLTGKWNLIAGLSGVLSIVSWLTITFIDAFKDLPYSYGEFMLGYAIALVIALIGYFVLERHPVAVV